MKQQWDRWQDARYGVLYVIVLIVLIVLVSLCFGFSPIGL